jgi:OOP family OmpA-OmpF porin
MPEEGRLNNSRAIPAPEGACLEQNFVGPQAGDYQCRRLRGLLLGGVIAELEKLRLRLENHELYARELSAVVAEAIMLRTQKDASLEKALQPTVENIFQNHLRRNPHQMVDQLFPLMGPSIRRSIAETFRSMRQGFNQTMKMSFSWRGLRWRLEALRTGKAFSDIVMLNTLIYRVEQVFLIHSATGIVLGHVHDEGIKSQDADLVSGMLTAIQDFVQDCFSSGESSNLESMRLGELTIVVARSSQLYLACVVRGSPPVDFNQQINTNLELIVLECADELANFTGDAAPFAKVRRRLLDCMSSSFVEDKAKPLFLLRYLPLGLALVLLLGFGYLKYLQYQYDNIVTDLGRQPGVVLTKVVPSIFGTWEINCLRDDLAVEPGSYLETAGMPRNRFHMDTYPYASLDESIVQRRVLNTVRLPPGVTMNFDSGQTLRLSGEAPMGWIIATREKALAIPGVKNVDTSNLKDPRARELNQLMAKIDGVTIYFPSDKALPEPQDAATLITAVDNIVQLEKLAAQMDMGITVTIYGHADAAGNEKYNYKLSQERAQTVAAMLYARGSSVPISTYGLGDNFAAQGSGGVKADAASRKIILKVHLARLTAIEQFNP